MKKIDLQTENFNGDDLWYWSRNIFYWNVWKKLSHDNFKGNKIWLVSGRFRNKLIM